MTWIKICGTTNLEDALTTIDAGAHALGFVFHEKSPRNIDPETARGIVASLPENVDKVGVFVDQSPETILEITARVGLNVVQVYGDATCSELAKHSHLKLIPVLAADKLVDFGIFVQQKASIYGILLDSVSAAQPGGTGKTFDWNLAQGAVRGLSLSFPVIVAGGLNPLNVGEAIKLFRPWGVDVVSGVEASPGKKDPAKMRAFIAAVRQAEKIV